MSNRSVEIVLDKYLWIEQNLPRYVTTRLTKILLSEDSYILKNQVTVNAIIIDIIYAFAKNSNWHTSPLFHEGITQHLLDRYEIFAPNTLEAAGELLGSSSSSRLLDPDRHFLISYLTAWHHFPFALDSERYSGVGPYLYQSIRDRSTEFVHPSLLDTLSWFSERMKSDQMWQADEWRLSIDLYPEEHKPPEFGSLFNQVLLLTNAYPSSGAPNFTQELENLAFKLQKVGVIFQLNDEGKRFELSRVGQQLTARYASSIFKLEIEARFLGWSEPWQSSVMIQKGEVRSNVLKFLLRTQQLPLQSVLPEFIRALEEEFERDFIKNYVMNLLEGDLTIWFKAAILACSKHLIEDHELPKFAANLIDSTSFEVQRAAADILFG